QKVVSKRLQAKIISNDRQPKVPRRVLQRRAAIIDPARVAIIVPAKAATTAPAEVRPLKCKTCNARPRIDSGADRRASASQTFNAAAVTDSVAAGEDGAVAAAGSGAGAEN